MKVSEEAFNTEVAINALYLIVCSTLLFFVIIGISLFYSGLTQRKSALIKLSLPIVLTPFIFIDWYIWGYSLCYSASDNRFIGNLNYAVLRNLHGSFVSLYETPRGSIPVLSHFLFNALMKVITVSFTFPGCVGERGRLLPMLVFVLVWSIIIYNPVTYWCWNPNGWLSTELNKLPVLDFAGGNCIHIVSGFTALAYSYLLGPRNPKILYNYRSSNSGFIVVGTFFLLFGWCGFIAGCDYKFSIMSISIMISTIISSCLGGVSWTLIDYYYSAIPLEGTSDKNGSRKISMISFCSGVMAGLVVITPAGGYIASPVGYWKSIIFGIVGGCVGNLATRLKYYFNIDDAFDIFALHGVTGWVGSLLTGIFASEIFETKGGWISGHFIQICYQLLGCVVVSAYVFTLSLVFLYIIDYIPGLHLRIDKTFNKRLRQIAEIEMKNDPESGNDVSNGLEITSEDLEMEQQELLGCDQYELNGEFIMDFVEFIKALSPEDYLDEVSKFSGSSNRSIMSNRKLE